MKLEQDLLQLEIPEAMIVKGRVSLPWVLHIKGCYSSYGQGQYLTTYIFQDSGHLKRSKEDVFVKESYAGNWWLITVDSDMISEERKTLGMGSKLTDRLFKNWQKYTVIQKDVAKELLKVILEYRKENRTQSEGPD